MIDPFKILADVKALTAAFAGGQVSAILKTAGVVITDAGEVVEMFEGGLMAAPPADAALVDELGAACEDCRAACEGFAPPVAAAPTVGAWGDGTLLKAFLANLPAILDFLSGFFKKD